jgi:hypothetical protein
MLAELAWASAETVGHRFQMMLTGTCTDAEYRRMLTEKLKAAQRMGFAAMSPRPKVGELLAPWHGAARRNSKRLRRRR